MRSGQNPRTPGFWPLRKDQLEAIPLPIPDNDGDDGDDNCGGDGCGGRGRGGTSGHLRGPVPGFNASENVFIPSNPFTNPASLEALKQSFVKLPNWKAAVIQLGKVIPPSGATLTYLGLFVVKFKFASVIYYIS